MTKIDDRDLETRGSGLSDRGDSAPLQIGILTFHFSDNFGALLQAYGLRTWLASLGHTVEFVNYHPSHVEEGGRFARLWDPRAFKRNAKVAYLRYVALRQRLFGNKTQDGAFDAFRHAELGVKGPPLRSLQEVEAHVCAMDRPYDAIVLGSDQIWSASEHYGLDRVYFGDFALPAGTRRIAYAPSFGRAAIAAEHHEELRRMLARLDGVSCRERSGVQIVSDLLGHEIANVPDPTLLLGDFGALSGNGDGPGGHVFCYALRSGAGISQIATLAGQQFNAEVLSPHNPHRRWRPIGRTVHPSPGEWVGLADRAAFIVTNSFHGTVFSILLKKPFLVVGLAGNRAALDERSLNLLDELGLRHRFVKSGDVEAATARMTEPIDWDTVTPRLQALQTTGRDYLDSQLARVSPA